MFILLNSLNILVKSISFYLDLFATIWYIEQEALLQLVLHDTLC